MRVLGSKNKSMQTNILGYPRIGSRRELKKACENFWAGNISEEELLKAGAAIRQQNWTLQNEAGIQLVPSNDFSFYDHVLDTTFMVGAVPALVVQYKTTKWRFILPWRVIISKKGRISPQWK